MSRTIDWILLMSMLGLGVLGGYILRDRARAIGGNQRSRLIEQLSFFTLPGEKRGTTLYGVLYVGLVFVTFGLFALVLLFLKASKVVNE